MTDAANTPSTDKEEWLCVVGLREDIDADTMSAPYDGGQCRHYALCRLGRRSRAALRACVEADTLVTEGELVLRIREGMEVPHAEVSLPRYRCEFTLSEEFDSDKLSAEFKQGLFKRRISKAEPAQRKRIQISVG